MTDACRTRSTCRLCGAERLAMAVPLTPTPIADHFVPASEKDRPQETYPLDLVLCEACGHVQLPHVVDPELLFRNYLYETRTSMGLVEHFQALAKSLAERVGARRGDLAVDVGSNDGSMLRAFRDVGLRPLGIDPALDLARRASEEGLPTVPEFFTAELGRRLREEHGPARIVTANNVFAHADDLREAAAGVSALLGPGGLFEFEVNYAVDILDNFLFDTVYHEHLCFHSVGPLLPFLREHGMELVDVERNQSKGGSIRCFARPLEESPEVSPAVGELLALEEQVGVDRLATWHDFAARIEACRSALRAGLSRLRDAGARIAGYGASHTCTTLSHHFGLDEFLEVVYDDNPLKQGLFSPGHHLPVHSSDALYEHRPDFVVVLAWRYAEPIMRRHRAYAEAGGRFVIPCPTPRFGDEPEGTPTGF